MPCHWNDLGAVSGPGSYPVKGVGTVAVIQEDIDRAADLGGNPRLTLEDVRVHNARERNYVIRFMRPDAFPSFMYKPIATGYIPQRKH